MGLFSGAPAPLFIAPAPGKPRFAFSSIGGRYSVLAFLPEPGPERDAAMALARRHASMFSDDDCLFFGILPDAESFQAAVTDPPWRWFSDVDGDLRRLYECEGPDGKVIPRWFALDPTLRLIGWVGPERGEALLSHIVGMGPPEAHAAVPMHAPVLIVPRLLEPHICKRLIALYAETGGTPSGVMRALDGKTVGVLDDFKKRRDAAIEDEGLREDLRMRLARRLLPEIKKVFQYQVTRIERYIVACYDASDGGYFRPHRDDTTPATAHRKFAVSINLNAEEFEGGDLRFPEFGRQTYRPPTGGAVVFSCSLLHEATPVTKGTRYAFLPFLFDDAGAKLREENLHTLVPALVEGGGAGDGMVEA